MKKTKDTEVAIMPQEPPKEMSIEAVIQSAITNNVPVETMEKLLGMRRELKAEAAKEAFDRAMAKFQAECPVIEKTKVVKTNGGAVAYRYAPIESIVSQVKSALQNNGFSYSTNMELLEAGVKVSVKVVHELGHSEVTDMTVPLGNKTNVMSQSQVVAAATTFAKRYAFCNAFGILTGDEDTDASQESVTSTPQRMAPYKVERKVQADDGAEEVPQRSYPKMTPANDVHALEAPDPSQKIEIARLLKQGWGYTMLGKSATMVNHKVKELTKLDLKEENFPLIIVKLQAHLDAKQEVDSFDTAMDEALTGNQN